MFQRFDYGIKIFSKSNGFRKVKAFIFGFLVLLQGKSEGNSTLITPYDVPASKFIEKLATYLKDNIDEVQPPAWADMAKTGSHVEKQPQNPAWWYVRSASILRKVYINGPIGLEKLRAAYGGRKDFGTKPEHAVKAAGKNIRRILQQLEEAGFVQKANSRGRIMTPKGRKLLKEVAEDLHKELVKVIPVLKKYQGE